MAIEPRDTEALISAITKHADMTEVVEVHTFVGYRRTGSVGVEEVYVEVHDRGPAAGRERFSVVARCEDPARMATGNPEPVLEDALALVHWEALDLAEN